MARPKRTAKAPGIAVGDVCEAMERIAPTHLAQEWDNVGLLLGDRRASVRRTLLAIDLMNDVVAEAVRERCEMVVAYHPPIFKAIRRLTSPGLDSGDAVLRCARSSIAIYSPHTALDAADGGTNDVIAGLCGLTGSHSIEQPAGDIERNCKLVVFVPADAADTVADAMFASGAGRIGDYEKCSFRIGGTGTFRGSESTQPAVGQRGRYETVDEIRLEAITPRRLLYEVVTALRGAHPYEEPAFDVYPLQDEPGPGIGRHGPLPRPITLAALSRKLTKATGATGVQIVGDAGRTVSRAVICAGAAGSLPFGVPLDGEHVVITGEMRHHDALAIVRRGSSAIALGHWASEKPVLATLADAIRTGLPALEVLISAADRDPFTSV
ncbi:MAG: Nif3-like dinuclear metal center hexameric protein [Phycisphaerales bacterium]|nr:Nif3-like dinuclear metal center hexameric protein [Phycisphaerales bacterium]